MNHFDRKVCVTYAHTQVNADGQLQIGVVDEHGDWKVTVAWFSETGIFYRAYLNDQDAAQAKAAGFSVALAGGGGWALCTEDD